MPDAPHTATAGAAAIDDADELAARALLLRCCGSTRWVDGMLALRPFGTEAGLRSGAEQVADMLVEADWLEAIAQHPRIGDRDVLRAKVAGWASGEQGGVDARDDALLDALEAGNRDYEERFGFIFLVCASGLDGHSMLAELERRMGGDPAAEWQVAASEQRKITQLRITKLLTEGI